MPIRTQQIIREVSPFLQQFYVKLIADCYEARLAGDVTKYREALKQLILSLPAEVVADALKAMSASLRRLGFGTVDSFDELFDYVSEFCAEVMSKYGEPTYRKRSRCVKNASEFLDAIQDALIKAMHKHGIFITHKQVLVGASR